MSNLVRFFLTAGLILAYIQVTLTPSDQCTVWHISLHDILSCCNYEIIVYLVSLINYHYLCFRF